MNINRALKQISIWETEKIFIQRWRQKYIFSTIRKYHFTNFLEFGCETGYFTNLISNISENVIAVDKNGKAIQYARDTKKCNNVKWVTQDILDYVIPENSFDGISFIECLTGFDKTTVNRLIMNAYKGLRKDGLILVCVALQSPKERWVYDESNRFKFFEQVERLLLDNTFTILLKSSVISTLQYVNGIANRCNVCRVLYPAFIKILNNLPEKYTKNYYILGRK